MRAWLLTFAAILAVGSGAGAAEARFQTGFTESTLPYFEPEDMAAARDHLLDARASFVRVGVLWADIAPKAPTEVEARDPGWEGYDWRRIDAAVRSLRPAGIRPVLTVERAPAWAEGPGDRGDAAPGSWKPSARALGDFATAMATRYSGSYTPTGGPTLPAVRHYQAWNEPNFPGNLMPQYEDRNGRRVSVAATSYRRMLNAFHDAVKAKSRRNTVITAATAPFGDYGPMPQRTPPAEFVRKLLCVSGRTKLAAHRCLGGSPRFDVLATNPFTLGAPGEHYPQRDDVGIADIARLRKPLAAAVRAGTLPGGRKPIWATEIGWDTRPPSPRAGGLPLDQQAAYLQESLFRLWRARVSVALWWRMRDGVFDDADFQRVSGVYFMGSSVAADQPKPSLTAFRFPFVAHRVRRAVELWGLGPGSRSRVTIERASAGGWKRLATVRTRSGRVFVTKRLLRPGTVLRARAGGSVSLELRVP